ncbi:MAG: carbohydrate binding family 9 domain-containing protein, partial [Longimicrobiales bacterium]|nr:carbohydrate binding family 9 domain-containing protein [Longimicrobiales bacterium]
MSRRLCLAATGALALALLPTTGTAQEPNARIDPETAPRPVGRAFRATGPIAIDGRLDDVAWSEAEPMDHFIQAVPDAGVPATEPTVVRILFDDEMLYIGAMCYESHPERLVNKTLEWELPGLSTHEIDVLNVFLDTFLDRRNAFMFIVNPAGAYRDGQAFNDSRNLDFGWDAIVHVRTEVSDSGWTVEMGIPWTSLRFDPTREEQVWGLNLFRRSRWKLEDSFW